MKFETLTEPPGTNTGSFIIGADHQLTLEIHMILNVGHKNYSKFLKGLRAHIDAYKGDGLIEYMSGI